MESFCLIYTLSTPWDGYHRGPFIKHIADAIYRDNGYIICAEPTITSIHTFIKYPERIKNWISGKYKIRKVYRNIYVFPLYTFENIFLSVRFKPLAVINRWIFRKQVHKVLKQIPGIEKLILIVHRPELVFLKGSLMESGMVYDCWDDFCSTSNMKSLKVKGNKQLERKLSADCSFIIATSGKLFERNRQLNENTFFLENGFSRSFMEKAAGDVDSRSLEFGDKPVIGYTGNIKHWIDFNLLKYIIENSPEFTFLFVGPVWKEFGILYNKFFKKFENVHVTGYVEYSDFISYLKCFDVGIIPFVQNDFMRSVNPNKFYEYIGAGIPVVSTDVGDLRSRYSEITRIAVTPQEFLKEIHNLAGIGEEEKRQLKNKLLNVAKEHTWDVKADFFRNKVMEAIKNS